MNIPSEIIVFGQKYRVIITNEEMGKFSPSEMAGFFDEANLILYIGQKQNKEYQVHTLLHEIVHAIIHRTGIGMGNMSLDTEEALCQNIATAFLELFKLELKNE